MCHLQRPHLGGEGQRGLEGLAHLGYHQGLEPGGDWRGQVRRGPSLQLLQGLQQQAGADIVTGGVRPQGSQFVDITYPAF